MKKLIFLFLIFGFSFVSLAQTNSWINFDQEYVKAGFEKSGVYRIGLNDISGISGAVNNPLNIQVYLRGLEIPKKSVGLNDGVFNEEDYIEVFLKANEGEQDSLVYEPHSARPPVKSNLFEDETFVFITLGKVIGREQESVAFSDSKYEDNWHLAEDEVSFSNSWSFNNSIGLLPLLMQSYFERGECWSGNLILADSLAKTQIKLKDYIFKDTFPISFQALINTRSHIYHDISLNIGNRKFSEIKFTGFNHFLKRTEIAPSELDTDFSFVFSTQSASNQSFAAHSWSNYSVRYPQVINFNRIGSMEVNLPESESLTSVVKVKNGKSVHYAYNISNPYSPERIPISYDNENRALIFVPKRNAASKIFLCSEVENFNDIRPATFQKIDTTANFIVITRKQLATSAHAYLAYRASAEGGEHKTSMVYADELFDQFNYGERSPIAIKNFLEYQSLTNSNRNRYLLLIGKGMSFPETTKASAAQDLVPTFGYPGSDNLFSIGLNGDKSGVPHFLTGRLSVTTDVQVINYLNKVKEHEASELQIWRKNILHLNGGSTVYQINDFKQRMENIGDLAEASLVNADVSALVKQTLEPVEKVDISQQVNSGIGLISFMGHASPTTPDFNIGYVSDASMNFSNKGKYPLMYFNGCGVGNVFYRYNALSTDWLLTPNKGSIAILANSFWSYVNTSDRYLSKLYATMFNTKEMLGQSIGRISRQTISNLYAGSYDLYDVANAQQVLLQGDPAVVVFPMKLPDYGIKDGSIKIQNSNPLNSLEESTEVLVKVNIDNLGLIDSTQTVNVLFEIAYADGSSKKTESVNVAKSIGNILEATFTMNVPITKITVGIDPNQQISEISKENNIAEMEVDWDSAKVYNQFPLIIENDKTNPILTAFINDIPLNEYSRVYKNAPKISFTLRDENPIDTSVVVSANLKTASSGSSFLTLPKSSLNLIQNSSNAISGWFYSPADLGKYELVLNARDKNGNISGQNLQINWEIKADLESIRVVPSPNPGNTKVKFSFFNLTEKSNSNILIYDILGRKLLEETHEVNEGSSAIYLDKNLNSGNYIYKVFLNGIEFSGKLMIY